jgi:two-component system, OmpR family, response regulator
MSSATPARRLRVLVVDDYADTRDTIRVLIDLWGHDVRTAADGPEALTLAETFGPDVVLLDVALPGMDGYEVARRLRQRPGLSGVTLVAITGLGAERDHLQAAEAGFAHYLIKPFDPEGLERLLGDLAAGFQR